MEYQLDIEPSDDDINEVRGGLIKRNTPFLEGIPKSQIAYYAMEEGNKVGSELLERIEEYAQSQGCTSSLVDTLSFQAKPFYEKRGYGCQMVLDNYPVDSSLSLLTKLLVKK